MTLLPVINQQLAILLAAKLAALAILVSCAEYLVLPRPLQDSGLMSWAVGRLRSPLLVKGPTGRVLNWLLAYPRILGLIALRAAIALLILFGPSAVVLNPLLLCLLLSRCLSSNPLLSPNAGLVGKKATGTDSAECQQNCRMASKGEDAPRAEEIKEKYTKDVL